MRTRPTLRLGLLVAFVSPLISVCVEAIFQVRSQESAAVAFLNEYSATGEIRIPSDTTIEALTAGLAKAARGWVQSPAAGTERRRYVAALASLELAARVPMHARAQILEPACELIRTGAADQFEREWLFLSAALEFDQLYNVTPVRHLEHALPRHGTDSALRAASLLTLPESITVSSSPDIEPVRIANAKGFGVSHTLPKRVDIARTAKAWQELVNDSTFGPEALLRLGMIDYLRGETGSGRRHFERVAEATTDPYLLGLAFLLNGLAADAAGMPEAARGAYQRAFNAAPGPNTGISFASALFLADGRSDAVAVLEVALRPDGRRLNPWLDPVGLRRHVSAGIASLRKQAALPERAEPDVLKPVAMPAFEAPSARSKVEQASGLTSGERQQFRSSARAVSVDVGVFASGRPVTGLTAEDFELFDNGVRQTTVAIGQEPIPLDLTVLLEMHDAQELFNPAIHKAGSPRWQPQQALADVVQMSGMLAPADRFRLLLASLDGPVETLALMPASQIPSQRAGLSPVAVSPLLTSTLFDATADALMRGSAQDRRSVVVAFTDGVDGASVTAPAKLLKIAERSDVVFFVARRATIGEQWARRQTRVEPQLLEERQMVRPVSARHIERVSEITGGTVFRPVPGESVVASFQRVLGDLRSRHILHYTPIGVPDGGWHAITVRLKDARNRTVRARRGYFGG